MALTSVSRDLVMLLLASLGTGGSAAGQDALLHCLCKEEDAEKFARLIFKHTTTIGIRKAVYDRYTLTRREETAGSPWGEVRVKESSGYGVSRAKAEFEDLARIARANGLSIEEVKKEVKA